MSTQTGSCPAFSLWQNQRNHLHQHLLYHRKYASIKNSLSGAQLQKLQFAQRRHTNAMFLRTFFVVHAKNPMLPWYLGLTQPFQRITETSRMKSLHLPRKDAQSTNSHTTALTRGHPDTPSCPFWRSMRSGLVWHFPQCRWWHASRCIVLLPLYPWHFPSEQKVVPWSSHTVAVLVLSKIFKSAKSTFAVVKTPISDSQRPKTEARKTPIPICMAPQAWL